MQQFADPDAFAKGKLEPMGWVDLQARIRLRDLRLFGTARVQSFSLLVFDWPGVPPYTASPNNAQSTPSFTGIVGADWTIRSLRLTPGVLFKLIQNASVQFAELTGGNNPPPALGRKLVVGPNGWISSIPLDEGVRPTIAVKVFTRWDLVSFASLIFELEVSKDFNDALLVISGTGMGSPIDTSIVTVNGQLFLQARF